MSKIPMDVSIANEFLSTKHNVPTLIPDSESFRFSQYAVTLMNISKPNRVVSGIVKMLPGDFEYQGKDCEDLINFFVGRLFKLTEGEFSNENVGLSSTDLQHRDATMLTSDSYYLGCHNDSKFASRGDEMMFSCLELNNGKAFKRLQDDAKAAYDSFVRDLVLSLSITLNVDKKIIRFLIKGKQINNNNLQSIIEHVKEFAALQD